MELIMACCGGFAAAKPIDETVKGIFNEHKAEILAALHTQDAVPETYQSQVVAGTNYKIKGKADGKAFTAVIFAALPAHGGKTQLSSAKLE